MLLSVFAGHRSTWSTC